MTAFVRPFLQAPPKLTDARRSFAGGCEHRGRLGTGRGTDAMTTLTMAKALNAGLRRAMGAEPKVLLAGEDIGKLGGVFGSPRGCRPSSAPTA